MKEDELWRGAYKGVTIAAEPTKSREIQSGPNQYKIPEIDWEKEDMEKNDPSLSSVHTTKHPIEASITGWAGYTNLSSPMRAPRLETVSGSPIKTGRINPHSHYNNDNGSLYKIAEQLGMNAYEFDILKRIARCRKKGQFKEDLQKIKDTVDLYLKEYE